MKKKREVVNVEQWQFLMSRSRHFLCQSGIWAVFETGQYFCDDICCVIFFHKLWTSFQFKIMLLVNLVGSICLSLNCRWGRPDYPSSYSMQAKAYLLDCLQWLGTWRNAKMWQCRIHTWLWGWRSAITVVELCLVAMPVWQSYMAASASWLWFWLLLPHLLIFVILDCFSSVLLIL